MANLCTQTLAGIGIDCNTSVGGIKRIYVANWSDVTEVTEAEGVITGITMASEAKFKEYAFRKQTGSMTCTLNTNEQNGTHFVQTDISLVFTRMETSKRIELSALSLGQLMVIVEDANGIYWLVGKEQYVSASAGGAQTGQAATDQNAFTLTLSDICSDYPYEVEKSVIATIVG